MEESKQKSEYILKVIFEDMPFMVAMTKVNDDTFIKVNRKFEEFFGLTSDEIIGRTIKDTGITIKPFNKDFLIYNLKDSGIVKNVKVVIRGKKENSLKGVISLCRITYNNEPCILHVMNDTPLIKTK